MAFEPLRMPPEKQSFFGLAKARDNALNPSEWLETHHSITQKGQTSERNMNVTSNIKAIRQHKGILQAEVARRLDIEPSSYHRLENRNDLLTLAQATRIAEVMDLSLIDLLTWHEPIEPKVDIQNADLLKKRIAELERTIELYEENRRYQNKLLEIHLSNPNSSLEPRPDQSRNDLFFDLLKQANPPGPSQRG